MISLCAVASLMLVATEAGIIKVCVKGKEADVVTKLAGASVKCYDEDSTASDDYMTGGTTASNGCVWLAYTTKEPKFGKFCRGWDWCANNPDIYCVITKSPYYKVYTETETNWNQDNTLTINAVMYIDRVARGDEGDANGCDSSDMAKFGGDVASALTGFNAACQNHDLCYASCEETQETCDDEFAGMMWSKCNDSWDHKTVSVCWAKADALYELVRDHGADAFAGSRDNCRRRLVEEKLLANRLAAQM